MQLIRYTGVRQYFITIENSFQRTGNIFIDLPRKIQIPRCTLAQWSKSKRSRRRNPSIFDRAISLPRVSKERPTVRALILVKRFSLPTVTDPHDPRIRKYKIRSISFPFSLNLAAFRGFSKRSFEIIGRVASVILTVLRAQWPDLKKRRKGPQWGRDLKGQSATCLLVGKFYRRISFILG